MLFGSPNYLYRLLRSHFTAPAQRSLLCHIAQKTAAAVRLHMISRPARQTSHAAGPPLIAMLCGSSLLQMKRLQAAVLLMDDFYALVTISEVITNQARPICGSVIYYDDLQVLVGLACNAFKSLYKVRLHVENRNYDADQSRARHGFMCILLYRHTALAFHYLRE